MNIKIHGLLGKIFGDKINIKIGNINQVLLAIDSVKPGFRKKYNELIQNGQAYNVKLVNREIHLIPSVNGSFFKKIFKGVKKIFKAVSKFVKKVLASPIGMIILGAVLIVATGGLGAGLFGGAAAGGGLFSGGLFGGLLGGAGGFTWGGFLANLGLNIGLSFLKAGLQMAMMKQPNVNGQQKGGDVYAASGGTVSSAQSRGKSYIFDQNQNSAVQGKSVSIAYGRFKYAPKIIQMSMHAYPTNELFEKQLTNYNLTF